MPAPDRLAGTLLGTALGDALGLPAEGMSARAIARRFGRVERFRLLGGTGWVSDDTEQAALVAQSFLRAPSDPAACARAFRRSLFGWFLRLPFGIGMATVRACLRIALGLRRSGVRSAGNGASMRAPVLGVVLHDRPAERLAFGRAVAEVTHTDARAVEGALFAAELAALGSRSDPSAPRLPLVEEASRVVTEESLAAALGAARDLAARGAPTGEAAARLGTTGFVVHTVPFAAFVFARFGDRPLDALAEAIAQGGDADTIAALVGAWVGALHGESGLPAALISRLQDGPFGPTHLRALAQALSVPGAAPPRYSPLRAFARNVLLWPVIFAHGLRRLVPL